MDEGVDQVREVLRSLGYAEYGLDETGALIGSDDGLKPGENLVLHREP